MSFSFSALFASAESAIQTIVTEATPILQLGETIAPAVAAAIPGAAPIIAATEAAAASITAIAPNAVQDVTAAIASGKNILAAGEAAVTSLESIFDNLFHITPTPGGSLILTPKTSAANAPSASVAAS